MRHTSQALIICEEGENRQKIIVAALKCGLSSVCCSSMKKARILLLQRDFRVVLCSDSLPDGDFHAVLKEIRTPTTNIPLIVLSHLADWDTYLKALGVGAFDYILCPPKPAEAERILWSALADSVHFQQPAHALA
jgi:DNA-binding NtrC family response regulator